MAAAARHGARVVTLHGIPNCDTVRRARGWLTERGVAHRFHDFRKDGVEEGWLGARVAEHGWETVLNRQGATFRALDDADKTGLNADKAVALMLAQPAMIKRPVLMLEDGRSLVGFKPDLWAAALA